MIRVVAAGLQTTVQDLGRFGWAQFGVSASGAADGLSLRAANLLAGNAEGAAGIEMTLVGPTLAFERAATIVLGGSDFGAGLPLWTPVEVAAGAVVKFGPTRSGARGCVAVRGGLAVVKHMGSASTHVLTGVGGRPLRVGDVLEIGEDVVGRARVGSAPPFARTGPLRATAGPQAGRFGSELYGSAYVVAEESNRMGIRLRGPSIPSPAGGMLTEGTSLGAVQIPPDGQPIVLFVEHQTTGGYPKPANVVSADLWRLGQLRPREEVSFELVTLDAALGLLQDQERWVYSLLRTVTR
jgi:antagonist of KipI